MLGALTDRVSRAKKVAGEATTLPFAVRCVVALCGVLAMSVAWPADLVTSRWMVPLLLIGAYPAVAPRGRGATVAALVVVTGWIVDTTGDDAPIALWRVLSIATLLYLGHTLTALAAVLPYDSVVNVDVITGWVARALVVVLISAVLTVVALGVSSVLAGSAFLVATLVGLAAAVGATLLLTRLLRRP